MEARAKIRRYIEKNLEIFDDEAVFSDSDNIFQMGLVNSLFAMKLLNFVEQEFAITIDDEDIEISNFSSIENIIGLLEKKTGTRYE